MSTPSNSVLDRRIPGDRRQRHQSTPDRRGVNHVRHFVAVKYGQVVGERSGLTAYTHVVLATLANDWLTMFHRSREHAEICKTHMFPPATHPRIIEAIETRRRMKIGERLYARDVVHARSALAD